ncbi:putative PHD type zinc finger protein with BAH domain-containing protein [Coemansia biformis]|uniref:PHD type zinc finger protein with BAH domain-containing protein n=1 Tax=Coemansia biformis TaxID=1286918 RepID=A0A9W7YIC4_9FUNG|nr:putative PHD type zinc finger protein with BAH domain-containing protein [Coemansia biformis]
MHKHLPVSNSDPALPPPPTSIIVANGTPVSVNDYVYLQPESDEPYYIGRVMEFVYVSRVRQPKPLLPLAAAQKQLVERLAAGGDGGQDREGTPTPSPTPAGAAQLRVRLAWFQRARDLPVTRVRAKDIRLLVATMHTDINPVTAIKGKCHVRHESEIADLNAWKAQPDHYWYTSLFDRYSTRFYEIVPVSQIRNAPQEVLLKLHDTYEFIFAETQKVNDLASTRRACTVCAKWCTLSESVKCTICEKHYHLKCLDPPPARKPAKGYGWQCAACLRRIQDQRTKSVEETAPDPVAPVMPPTAVDAGDHKRITRNKAAAEESTGSRRSLSGTGVPNTPSAVSGAAASSDTESRQGSKRLKISHSDSRSDADGSSGPIQRPKNRGLWPFRYFGFNTNIDDVLHDDERIYPRAVSRIGPKYQAIIPDMISPSGPVLDKELAEKRVAIDRIARDKGNSNASRLIEKVLHSHNLSSSWQPPSHHHAAAAAAGGGQRGGRDWGSGAGGGGGGGTTRWHGKSAEQMDRVWDEIEVRRGCRDAELFFRQPKSLPDDELDMYMEAIIPFLQRHFATVNGFTLLDCQDTALHGLALHKYDVEEALISIPDCPKGYTRQRDAGDYWTPDGMAKFSECLREYGSNLQAIRESIPENTCRAVTLRYYLMRHTSAGEQLLEAFTDRNHASQRRLNLGQGESAVNAHADVASDAGISTDSTQSSSPLLSGIAGRECPTHAVGPHGRAALRCINCATDSASRWSTAPADLYIHNTRSASSRASATRRVVCGDCRSYWLRYGLMPDQDVIGARKAQPSDLPPPARASVASDEPQRASSRAQNSLAQAVLKSHMAEVWPLTPCGVCRQATGNNAEVAVLVCGDCGLCVHLCCSGYPADAKFNPKRWRCGVCTNVTNPTMSINYACVLCRREPPAHTGSQPRPLMWRTVGSNWAHPLCALAVREASLSYSHGNVIVGGTMAIPEDSWRRPCTGCAKAGGVVRACDHAGCSEGAHTPCAGFSASGSGSSGGNNGQPAPQVILAIRASGGDTGAQASLRDGVGFVDDGGKAEIVVKCARHAGASRDVDLDAVDGTGHPMLAAVVATKMAGSGPAPRGAMPRSPTAAPVTQTRRPPAPNGLTNGAASQGLHKKPSPSPPSAAAHTNAFAWASPAKDPACSRCSIGFSPIWWPVAAARASRSTSANGDGTDISVLCQRCYSTSAGENQRGNLTSSL